MGLALHCHGELKLKKWKRWKRKRYKEEDGVVPTSPSTPPSSPNVFFVPPKCQRWVSLRENRRKGANLPHQRTMAPGGRVSPPCGIGQTGAKIGSYRLAVSSYRQAVRSRGAWRLTGGLFRLALASCRQALPVDIFLLLLAISGHSLIWIFGQSFPSTKRTQKMGISDIFRSM